MMDPGSSTGRKQMSAGLEYDVFLSFRGEDTRNGFTGHLYKSLFEDGISVFIDSEDLKKGERIDELFRYIERSEIFIPIFSENYARSKWCLMEAAKITEVARILEEKRHVIPVFFKVEPSNVRNQRGTFDSAFRDHKNEREIKPEELKRWRDALKWIAGLSGYNLKETNGHEPTLVERVRGRVRELLPRVPFKQSPIGINSCVDAVMRKLGSREIGVDGVCRVGIWGSGGIGKTTLAKAIFNLAFPHFQSSRFMEGVKDTAKIDRGLCSLQAKLISELSRDRKVGPVSTVDEGLSMIQRKFKNKKVFIVLDDVQGTEQLDALTGDPSSVDTSAQQLFGAGSKIIITTRDRRVLVGHGLKENEIYEHKELHPSQAIALFSRHAFCGKTVPPEKQDLVKKAVGVSGGLPLALVVLGPLFRGKEKREEWEDELEELKRIPAEEVFKRLKISYDGLDLMQQSVFLDVACFFVGFKKDYPVYMWEACGYSPGNAIRVLQDRSLITVDGEGRIRKHEQIREMGLWIVQEEGKLKPWRYTRLWEKDDVLKMLHQKQKNKCVEGIVLNVEEGCVDGMKNGLKTKAFKKIINLRILALKFVSFQDCNISHFPSSLRSLEWRGFQMEMLNLDNSLNGLAVLKISESIVTQIQWKETWLTLKVLHISECSSLEIMPSFSSIPEVEILVFDGCTKLFKIDDSIGMLKKLKVLSMRHCESLEELPRDTAQLTSLKTLNLQGCEVLLSLRELPPYLKTLEMQECKAVESLPELPSSLEELNVQGCEALLSLPELPPYLKTVEMQECKAVESLPQLPSYLEKLNLQRCEALLSLPELPPYLKTLEMQECKAVESLPLLPSSLEELNVQGCEALLSLPELPPYLKTLEIQECKAVESLPLLPSSLEVLQLQGCERLRDMEGFKDSESELKRVNMEGCRAVTYESMKTFFKPITFKRIEEVSITNARDEGGRSFFIFPSASASDPLLLEYLRCHLYIPPGSKVSGIMEIELCVEDMEENRVVLLTTKEACRDPCNDLLDDLEENQSLNGCLCYTIQIKRHEYINCYPGMVISCSLSAQRDDGIFLSRVDVMMRTRVIRRGMDSNDIIIDQEKEGTSSEKCRSVGFPVFLSFDDDDYAASTFVKDHLFNALKEHNLVPISFKDNECSNEEMEFNRQIVGHIKNSKICIPIISASYAKSKRCLRETVEMVDHKKLIAPVYLELYPSDVVDQNGQFWRYLNLHESDTDKMVIEEWREALVEAVMNNPNCHFRITRNLSLSLSLSLSLTKSSLITGKVHKEGKVLHSLLKGCCKF